MVEASEKITVALDTEISRELLLEGYAREFVNNIQNKRKESGFNVTDKIILTAITTSADIQEAIEANRNYIEPEVLAVDLKLVLKEPKTDDMLELNGEFVTFQVVKQE